VSERTKNYAEIAIPSPLTETLTYAVPDPMGKQLQIGMRVVVPLGKRRMTGVVVGFAEKTTVSGIREIIELLDERPVIEPPLLHLCQWAARYYLMPLGEVLGTALPAGVREERRRVVVVCNRDAMIPEGPARGLWAVLREKRQMPLRILRKKFAGRNFAKTLDDLVKCGAVEVREAGKRGRRAEKEIFAPTEEGLAAEPWQLTTEQATALRAVEERIQRGGFETFLLFGITGSGKTEIYLRALQEAQRHKKQSLILVPEISLTLQLLERVRARFPGQVGVLHSGLTPAQRRTQWWRMIRGDVTVVVGARSAVFAPLPELGLIIVDEEHDPSYKQEEGLRYQARDLAVVRGRLLGCPVVLGSATPALESFHNACEKRYHPLELTRRVAARSLPTVELVDLRTQVKTVGRHDGNSASLFSAPLQEALRENYRRGQQTLLFLNRRGFANFLQCRLCGFVERCPNCSVTLTFHSKQRRLMCHHCDFHKLSGDLCPGCSNLSLLPFGIGTEQVEQELAKLVPNARAARMDRDTTRRRGSQQRLLSEWEKGEIEILVGTQMIAKGHDVAGVTLVGVLLADLSLNIPDFRAAERTFQLLSQVAGRAGRGNTPGRVIVQTYVPHHYALSAVVTHDYRNFFQSEIDFRCALNYPPFTRLVLVRLDGPKPLEVKQCAESLGVRLRAEASKTTAQEIQILGPAPAPIERLRGRYRWQMLIKGKQPALVLELARRAQKLLEGPRTVRLGVDVDPQNML